MTSNRTRSIVAALLMTAVTVQGQETGSIAGQVTDPAGAAVTSAAVTVRNDATGASFSAASDQSGFYRVPQLAPGTYTITVALAGFRTLKTEGILVRVNDRLRVDLNLEIGQVSETLTVTGKSPLLQTEDATTGQVVDNQKIVDLPLNNRNWLQLATLAPATVSYVNVFNTEGGNRNNVVMNLGGTHTNQANYLLDGTDNSNFVSAGAVASLLWIRCRSSKLKRTITLQTRAGLVAQSSTQASSPERTRSTAQLMISCAIVFSTRGTSLPRPPLTSPSSREISLAPA